MIIININNNYSYFYRIFKIETEWQYIIYLSLFNKQFMHTPIGTNPDASLDVLFVSTVLFNSILDISGYFSMFMNIIDVLTPDQNIN